MKNRLFLLFLAALSMGHVPALAQKTNYSDEFMQKVKQYPTYYNLRSVEADPATGQVSVMFDCFCREHCYSECWVLWATDKKGNKYKSPECFSAPFVNGMWTRVNMSRQFSFTVDAGIDELSVLRLEKMSDHRDIKWKDIKIKWIHYDTIYPAWSAESYASDKYTTVGTKTPPYTGMTKCVSGFEYYTPLRLIGAVGNRETGEITFVLAVCAKKGGSKKIRVEKFTIVDEDGEVRVCNYDYNAKDKTIVPEVYRELRYAPFRVPVGAASLQRVDIDCKVGNSLGYVTYRCDNVPIQWVDCKK